MNKWLFVVLISALVGYAIVFEPVLLIYCGSTLLGYVIVYTLARLISKAIYKSYNEEKNSKCQKKNDHH